jgi:glycosyltransferase involved in cell wall biosynthesis
LAGVPAIIASTALLADEIVDRGMGYACDPLDTQALVDLMRRVGGDDELTRRLSERAFENSRELANTPESWTAALLALYEERLAESVHRTPDRARESHGGPDAAIQHVK